MGFWKDYEEAKERGEGEITKGEVISSLLRMGRMLRLFADALDPKMRVN